MTCLPGFENPIGYIVGVRQWKYDKLLCSVTADYTWKPWEVVEGDLDKVSPLAYIPHGVYAAKEEHEEEVLPLYRGSVITGKVALWGRVAEHTKGYRAQYAYPISLDHCTDRHVDMDQLREIYLNPPTETTQTIVEERLQWISEEKREKEKYSQSAFRLPLQWFPRTIPQSRQAATSQAYQRAVDASWKKQPAGWSHVIVSYNPAADDGITWKIDDAPQ